MITYHDDGSLRDELGQVWAWAETDSYGKNLAAAFNHRPARVAVEQERDAALAAIRLCLALASERLWQKVTREQVDSMIGSAKRFGVKPPPAAKGGCGVTTKEIVKLLDVCPDCGSGDVWWCQVSVRAYCRDCGRWGRVNFGTIRDGINEWNRRPGSEKPAKGGVA